MVVLTPLGLIAPGGAFGEDAPEDLDLQKYHLNAVPSGLRHYAGFWHNALFDGYDFTNDSIRCSDTSSRRSSASRSSRVVIIAIFGSSGGCGGSGRSRTTISDARPA